MRLRKRGEFLSAQRRGRRVHGQHLIIIAAPAPATTSTDQLRLGITASKKVGKAVQRNLVKRRLREIFRLHAGRFSARADVVVIARHSASQSSYAELRRDFLQSLQRALDRLRGS